MKLSRKKIEASWETCRCELEPHVQIILDCEEDELRGELKKAGLAWAPYSEHFWIYGEKVKKVVASCRNCGSMYIESESYTNCLSLWNQKVRSGGGKTYEEGRWCVYELQLDST